MAEQETTFTDDQDGEGPSSPFASLTVTQAEVATSARIIANGLLLKVKGKDSPFATFTYGLAPTTEKSTPVDWKVLVDSESVESQHIRCHVLQPGDDLSAIIPTYQEGYAMAVVLINTEDSYDLPPSSTEGMERSSFPVLVLTRSHGRELMDSLDRLEGEEVYAKVDVESLVDVSPRQLQLLTASPRRGDTATSELPFSREPGVGQRLKQFFGGEKPRSSLDLKAEIKKLMFSGDACVVSEDVGTFTMIMATFQLYEKYAKKAESNHPDVNETLKKFMKHFPQTFVTDFPFYLVLAYRMHLKTSLYQCDELGNFIIGCIDKLESMESHLAASTFNTFLHRRDFSIMFGEENSSISVFHLLEMACIELGTVSHRIRMRGVTVGKSLYPRFVYNRMAWVSLALRLHAERGIVTRNTIKMWKDHLIKYQNQLTMGPETVEEVKKGLQFGHLIQLPSNLTFSSMHMVDLLVSEGCVRPFLHIRHYIHVVESYIPQEMEFLQFLTALRAVYDSWLKQPDHSKKITAVSVGGTLAATLQEGVSFLDAIHDIWARRQFNFEVFDNDCIKWLMLLLHLIDIAGPSPEQHLKKFLTGRTGVVKKYRSPIVKYVIEMTNQNFAKLSVQQFFPLYKAFRIWPNKFLEEYLSSYVVPPAVKINDPTWKEFFSEVVSRFTGEHHRFLLDFLKSVANRYRQDSRAAEFILDLLLLEVPKLFTIEGSQEAETATVISLEFTSFLRDFINRYALKHTILGQMGNILGAISNQRNEFQQLVLSVLQKEVVPEFKALQGSESVANTNLRSVLHVAINTLRKDLSWMQALTSRQKFCWGIVASCCSKIPVTSDHFEWVHSYSYLISQLGHIYNAYCMGQKLGEGQRVLSQNYPHEIAHSPSEDVKRYFDWVRKVQDVLFSWRDKFLQHGANYDEILLYASNQPMLDQLGHTICASPAVVDSQDIQKIKNTLLQDYETLNVYLIRYIPGQPDVKWSTLPSLLADNGVALPANLLDPISKYIQFPGEERPLPGGPLLNPLPSNTSGMFQPGHEIFLKLSKSMTLKDLSLLVQGLQSYLDPIIDHLDMLVFFKLHRSEMFNKHLRLQLRKESEMAQQKSHTPSVLPQFSFPVPIFSGASFRREDQETTEDSVPLNVLLNSLTTTKELFLKLIHGTATYFEIIAEGELNLETLDIEKEFNTLSNFSAYLNLPPANYEGLSGVRSMLELFQYTIHIQNIDSVCEQYHLQGCQNDEQLHRLLHVVETLREEGDRAKLTPLEASRKMEAVKKILCLSEKPNAKCLDLFPAVADSAAFYQFVRDKRFVGDKGQVAFRQQYTLITAHLQHEEYDETVLNHLYAAFKFIQPFMDTRQNFHSLMKKVTNLDATNGLKQLETVNQNITLIRLWFSRAEGDTLQNVANELEGILKSGHYIFRLTSDEMSSGAEIMLEYSPHSSPATEPHSQPFQASLEEADTEGGPPTSQKPSHRRTFSRHESRTEEIATSNVERWSSEQITDFVRKLGFLDTEKEGGDNIKHFLHINEVAYKLLELNVKLKELGHPDYLKPEVVMTLPCSRHQDAADDEVRETEVSLSSWTQRVAVLRSEYDWLLFFSVPKLLLVYSLLKRSSEDAEYLDQLYHEISFLCASDKDTRNTTMENMKKSLTKCADVIKQDAAPMHAVGRFLGVLFSLHSLPKRAGEGFSRPRSVSRVSLSTDSTQLLHYCPGYSQRELVRLIISIYDGVPEAFEVFHCRLTSTEEELSLFLKRAAKHPLQYLLLEVNRLPFKLQEYLIQVHLSIQQKARESRQQIEAGVVTSSVKTPSIHFVETAPSVLREMPWVHLREHKELGPSLSFEDAKKKCLLRVALPENFACIQLVYGHAGDGKTHYIKQQLAQCAAGLTVAVNEAFTPLNAINKLRTLPLNQRHCGIFFNFTMLPPGESVDKSECVRYHNLMEVIGWFFFDLLILGYVEDPTTGRSFRIPGSLAWAIFIEVPSRDLSMPPGEALKQFRVEVPALGLLGTSHYIHPETPYSIDPEVQLVCKYLSAYKIGGLKGIDRLYREGGVPVKFSLDPDLPASDCHALLADYMPDHIKRTKITQRLFIKYMKRRCSFLDNLPAFNFNSGYGEYQLNEQGNRVATDTSKLGSTLMGTMLKEVGDFCDPAIKENWSLKPHQQLIYDFKDGGASLGLVSLHPDQLRDVDKTRFRRIGVKIPSMADLYSRELLDGYLSRALNIELENNHLTPIDDSAYVLTLDYCIKMLNIHERCECSVPVIIEGETGVGKTALVEMLSKLWNHALLIHWKHQINALLDFIRKQLGEMSVDASENYQACLQAVESLSGGHHVREEELVLLGQLPDANTTSGRFYSVLLSHLLKMTNDPMIALLSLRGSLLMEQLFDNARVYNSAEATASLLYGVLNAELKPTFYKVNVHAAMTPSNIHSYFQPVFEQARALKEAYNRRARDNAVYKVPFVTVFLDEVNTSSCVGLFKEIIVDRTFDGQPFPDNVFIVAACNPHRGNSLAAIDTFVRGSYYVRRLHPTLQFLMWDYGSLDEHQERDYINSKMKMLNRRLPNAEVASLTDLIVTSQNLMRAYAFQHLKSCDLSTPDAKISSRSCVSQRDIQRVFTFYQWLMDTYSKYQPHGHRNDYSRRAVLVALGIVYYMRLNNKYRKSYEEFVDKESRLPNEVSFSRAFSDELEWYMKNVELPAGIAKTQALKENLFATIVCMVTHTPLIIVGAPGSSKTLSFNLAIANLKGQESKIKLFRDTSIFRSLDPHYYQCSRRTTSNEIQTVFSRAINRQRSHTKFSLPIYCVVFMDEAGLPEESHESLKVLHYHLDRQEVSFVAITNHTLDAAKTNRAVSLYRPEASEKDLETLAKGCLCSDPENPEPELRSDLNTIVKFCAPYSHHMSKPEFRHFFGLRDFIHFVNYLRRHRLQLLTPNLVIEALERNFNGSEYSERIYKSFLTVFNSSLADVKCRSILDVLRNSLDDRPQLGSKDISENEVRYKLIIDPSEDDSLVRLLFSFGVLERKKTKMFVCSDFPGDSQLQKINTIAAIRHSAIQGHTVVMSQTDDIHESFYDLFNQRFRRIDDPQEGPRYYTNIAIGAHLKPCRVHPDFQCVVVLKKSEVKDTPAPFLNRFEKYCITHRSLLETALGHLPSCMSVVVQTAMEKVHSFIECVEGPSSLYGLKEETLDSLILTLLPPLNHTFEPVEEQGFIDETLELPVLFTKELIHSLRFCAGFNLPVCSMDEIFLDAHHIFNLVRSDPEFDGLIPTLTHAQAVGAIAEAMRMLHTAPAPQDDVHLDLSPESCMAISLLEQWLVRHLGKKLMQLMTTEALVLHRKKIPSSYLESYINCHAHFSLSQLIFKYHTAICHSRWNMRSMPTKLLCFTRSSQLVHQLPTQFPSPIFDPHAASEAQQSLSDLVFADTSQLMVFKLSSILSQSGVQELLRSFVRSDSAQVLLLVANMQDASRQMINHIRIMIEEAEVLGDPEQRPKLFVLLLHFPPANFFDACYPSLFLQGWDHCYLDSIAHSNVRGMVNIQDWLTQCCFQQFGPPATENDSLLEAMSGILHEAVPILSSRVFFGSKKGKSFNSLKNGTQRSKVLRELLFDKGVGGVLCERFRTYWKPSVMAEQLERAAMFSKNHESTLNITDSIQTVFKNSFFDFLVYMVSRINEDFNLDVLFDADCTPAVQQLFLDILREFPVPKLSQLKVLSINLPTPNPVTYTSRFPFFKMVSEVVERIVEQSWAEANQQLDILREETDSGAPALTYYAHDRGVIIGTLQEVVLGKVHEKIQANPKESLAIALGAMAANPELWKRYFSDFTLHKLHLEGSCGAGIAQYILDAFFGQLHKQEAENRIVGLHVYIRVYQLDLARMATVLRPLNKIQQVARGAPDLLSPLSSSPSEMFINVVQQTQNPLGTPEDMSAFVVNTLFHALVGSTYGKGSLNAIMEKMTVWYRAYRDVQTLPTLKPLVYQSLVPDSGQDGMEARLNVMQATFLALQTRPALNPDLIVKGQQIFQTLLTRYFTEDLRLKAGAPHLVDVATVAVEVLSASAFSPSLHRDNQSVRLLMEGLFAHFFSPHRPRYHPEDTQWFMELANEQVHWQVGSLEKSILMGSFSEDLVQTYERSERRRSSSFTGVEVPQGAISMCVFKLYLSRILGSCDQGSEESGPLLLYQYQPRYQVGKVLTPMQELGLPGPYIPSFYQECTPIVPGPYAENVLMQQPLCHLYFLTVLEHLRGEEHKVATLVRSAGTIQQLCSSDSTALHQKVLLYIELQAVVQVVIQLLAEHLDPAQPQKLGEVHPILGDLNALLDNEEMGGGSAQGHGMVFALHLVKLLKSSRRFIELLTRKYDTICKGINCLEPIHKQLKTPPVPTPHLLPFMQPGGNGTELSALYLRVARAMVGIHNGSEEVDELVRIAEECVHSVRMMATSPDSTVLGGNQIDKRLSFRMMVWLVAYYEFYNKKIKSEVLCYTVDGTLSPFLKEEGYIQLIQCFLNPGLMLRRPESPNPLRDDELVLQLTPEGGHQPVHRGGELADPLYQLFMPEDPDREDQSDVDLRHSLANMVAMVLGCPSRSNHLWYHMFSPEDLHGSFMTGFMYNNKIHKDGLLYDCGVELSPEGQYGRQDYLKHASRGTYTLHSLYLLLWANFGAFCIALLTQTEAEGRIHGPLISEWLSVRHYCISQLRTVWMHMRNNLGISDEERSFLLMRCCKRFYELLNTDSVVPDSLRGVFRSRAELDGYETMWHSCVYQPSWNELRPKFTQYSELWQHRIFIDLTHLAQHYPQFPSERDFTHNVLSSGELKQHSEGGDLRLLSQFALEWPRLQAAGLLLPDLVEFYQWLHTSLSHLVTYDKATHLTIGTVVDMAAKRYSYEMGQHLLALYQKLRDGYNQYVEMIGGAIGVGACAAARRGNKIYTIADDIPLLHFLSDVTEEEQGNDWLYTVIADIVSAHNTFIEGLYSIVSSQEQAPIARLLPDEPPKVYPTEVNEKHCIVGKFKSLHGLNDFLQLLRSRHQPSQSTPSQPQPHKMSLSLSQSVLQKAKAPSFQLAQLQEDVVTMFIAGKPLIERPQLMRTTFKFRQSLHSMKKDDMDVVGSAVDLGDIAEKLSDHFKFSLEEPQLKRLEYEFHSVGYHTMMELVTALKTIAGHLIKALLEQPSSAGTLEQQTIPQFMLTIYDHLNKSREVLEEIGIHTENLTDTQLACISELPLPAVYSCLQLFVKWIKEGLYDFCSLPFAIKTHITYQDQVSLQQVPIRWAGTPTQLLDEIKAMSDVLSHSETHITKMVNQAAQKPIMEYLKDIHTISDDDRLPQYIPKTILIHHYVSFRLALRRLVLRVQQQLASGGQGPESMETRQEQWNELVADLWEERLPHLRDVNYDGMEFIFDPQTGKYGFQEGGDFDSDGELADDLMGEVPRAEETTTWAYQSMEEPVTESQTPGHQEQRRENEEMTLERMIEKDPTLRERVLSMARSLQKDMTTLEHQAAGYTPEDVVEFLSSIGLDRYTGTFLDCEISGEVLLEANVEVFSELGVESVLDRLRISVLFKRKLSGGVERYPLPFVLKFLEDQKLQQYAENFQRHGIDGEFLLQDKKDVDEFLKEIGVSSPVVRVKIRTKFKALVSTS